MKRFLLSILFILSPIFIPWWLVLIFGILLILKFNHFYEFVFVAFLIDSIYGKEISFFDNYFIFTIISIFLYIILVKIKENLRY
jgi:hypothetical protein